ncbi:MAG: hypothetical protein AAF623_00690 [Planctomycetota bacterium]
MNGDPLAYFITWTVYGTFLQGDSRWWRAKQKGSQPPQPRLEQWHRDRLRHNVVLLNERHRVATAQEISRLSDYRGWKLWVANPRTNHVHVVVSATEHSGKQIRDQMKANCTRVLRELDPRYVDRPIWTTGGDLKCINTDKDLEQSILYAGDAQENMNRGK